MSRGRRRDASSPFASTEVGKGSRPPPLDRLDAARTERRGGDAGGGFTLIETLVALAVFSIAALALLRLEGATVAATARLQQRQLGQIVARNVALEAFTDPVAPAIGVATGAQDNGGRGWTWSRAVARVGDSGLIRIDVRVAGQGGEPAGALTLLRSAR